MKRFDFPNQRYICLMKRFDFPNQRNCSLKNCSLKMSHSAGSQHNNIQNRSVESGSVSKDGPSLLTITPPNMLTDTNITIDLTNENTLEPGDNVYNLTLNEATFIKDDRPISTVRNSLPTSSFEAMFENGKVYKKNENRCQIGKKHKVQCDYEDVSKIKKMDSKLLCSEDIKSNIRFDKLGINTLSHQSNLLENQFLIPADSNHTIISSKSDYYNDINTYKPLEIPDQACLSKTSNANRTKILESLNKVVEGRPKTDLKLTGENHLFDQLLEMFPDIDRNFLKTYCSLGLGVEQVANHIFDMNYYPKEISNNHTISVQVNNTINIHGPKDFKCVLDNPLSPFNRDDLGTIAEINEYSFNMSIDKREKSGSMDIQSIAKDLSAPPALTRKTENCSDLIDNISDNTNNKKVDKDIGISSQFNFLTQIFPDADRSFLEKKCLLDEQNMETFILTAMEKKDYPKLINQIETEEPDLGLYTGTDFNLDHFLKIFPDPVKYFMDESRACKYNDHAVAFLKRRYRYHSMKQLNITYRQFKYNLSKTCEALDAVKSISRTTKRNLSEIRMPTTTNIQFLQEACFIEHEAEIKSYFNIIKEAKEIAYKEAEEKGELIECGCCYSHVMFEECAACNEGDLFCKPCIQKSAEVRVGDGHTTFPCLSDCGSNFSIHLLQNLIDARMFSRLLRRIQLDEVKAADIEGLEVCPFCEFATIPHPDTNLFTCLNPECLIESCRKCHKVNHIPKRCEEVENEDQEKARKFIEDEMTKALVRECYKCKKNFIKVDGCNKMTCTCGARMCYVCRQPIVNYEHFNGPGGSQNNKCPLYSTDQVLHVEAVKAVAQKALKEVVQKNPKLKLVHDPSKILPTPGNRTLPPGVEERINHVLNLVVAGVQQLHAVNNDHHPK